MLRVSNESADEAISLNNIVEHARSDEQSPAEYALLAFTNAVFDGGTEKLAAARQLLVATLGEAAMVDAAAVIGNFYRMVRIADGTGIPLDEPMASMSSDIRDELGINNFSQAGNTPEMPGWKIGLMRLVRPMLTRMLARKSRS